jgi:hypothetical protein
MPELLSQVRSSFFCDFGGIAKKVLMSGGRFNLDRKRLLDRFQAMKLSPSSHPGRRR